jgi:hypothetical protein
MKWVTNPHNKELCDLYTVNVIKSKMLRWIEHLARMRRQEQYKEYLLESDNMGDQVNKIPLRWILGT